MIVRAPILFVAVASALVGSGCRDGVAPYESPPPFEFGNQLTYGSGNDRTPVWTPDGSRVVYSTDSWAMLPCIRGVVLSIPADGGTAQHLIDDAQRSSLRPFTHPTLSPDGLYVAYYDLLGPQPVCTSTSPVVRAFLRVRRVGSNTNMLSDPSLEMDPGTWTGTSWAPDGQHLVISTAQGLAIWRVGEPDAALIPGTTTGCTPAWAPAGDRIALVLGSRVVVIAPDGTPVHDLGPGADPAWSPDGQYVYIVRGDVIVRVRVQDGQTQLVPHTTGAHAPAVSPDGSRLAFVRESTTLPRHDDIWVIDL